MEILAQLIGTGLLIGAAYALVATGLALIFGVLGIVNFAHGEYYMLGAFVAYAAVEMGAPYPIALILSAIAIGALGMFLYEAFVHRLEVGRDFERSIIMMLGLSLVLQNGALVAFTGVPRTAHTGFDLDSVTFAGVTVPVLLVLTGVVAALALAALYVLLDHTHLGRAMRALSQNRRAALMIGIRPERTARATFAIGSALAGLAGASLGLLYSVDPVMGLPVLFKAFAVITIGGLGSIQGATVAGIALGVVESVAGGLGSKVIADSSAFVLMIAILVLRPQGLFGRKLRA